MERRRMRTVSDSSGMLKLAILIALTAVLLMVAGCGTGASRLVNEDLPEADCTLFARQGSFQGRWTSTDYEGCALSIFGECGIDPSQYRITFSNGQCEIVPQ